MTQIITISANTAAIAIESLRPGRRLSVKDQVADRKADADRVARRAENAGDPGEVEFVVSAPNVSIDLMTAGQNPHAQVTYHQAQAAYRDLED